MAGPLRLCARAGDAAERVEALVLAGISSGQEAVRLAAAQWAGRLWPFDHVPARYVCALAAGDDKLGVREAGAAGLLPPKPTLGASRAVPARLVAGQASGRVPRCCGAAARSGCCDAVGRPWAVASAHALCA
jgi:hypothetical protein